MFAKSPEEICRLFQQYLKQGDLDAVLTLYDANAVFLNQAGELKSGEELKRELTPLAASRSEFAFKINQVVQTGDIALMHTEWNVSGPKPMFVYAIEVAKRQADGSWRWLIGDPFTVGKHTQRISRKGV